MLAAAAPKVAEALRLIHFREMPKGRVAAHLGMNHWKLDRELDAFARTLRSAA